MNVEMYNIFSLRVFHFLFTLHVDEIHSNFIQTRKRNMCAQHNKYLYTVFSVACLNIMFINTVLITFEQLINFHIYFHM